MSYGVALRNGVPFTLGTIAALCTNATGSAWSPLSLWPDGIASPGMWISPSTLPASFNDYTGTTPVATPGTVADSANPVGLALDIRAGAPTTLGPELVVNGDFATDLTGWTVSGTYTAVRDTSIFPSGGVKVTAVTGGINGSVVNTVSGLIPGKTYKLSVQLYSPSSNGVTNAAIASQGNNNDNGPKVTQEDVIQTLPFFFVAGGSSTTITLLVLNSGVAWGAAGDVLYASNISVKEIPGNHMLQATSAARPLESARVNLLTYTEDFSNAAWASVTYGTASLTKTPNYTTAPDGSSTACRVLISDVDDAAWLQNAAYTTPDSVSITRTVWMKSNTASSYVVTLRPGNLGGKVTVTPTWTEFELTLTTAPAVGFNVGLRFADGTATACDISIWHPQTEIGTTVTPYQSVPGDGSTYATDFPVYQKYDGTDDGMATASFAAGTLINGMDCLIPVRRDSAANAVCGLYESVAEANKVFGIAESGSGSGCVGSGAGTPTVWVDNTQLTGGTAVTRGTLHTALTVGSYHILEFRNLDLSAWTATGFGLYSSYVFPGARGDIMLFESTASTEDKDAARQWLADYYGVTLP